jgi:hypothetical protein
MVAVGRRELEPKLYKAVVKFRSTFSGRTEGVERVKLLEAGDCILTVLHVAAARGGDLEHLDRGLLKMFCCCRCDCLVEEGKKKREGEKVWAARFGRRQVI